MGSVGEAHDVLSRVKDSQVTVLTPNHQLLSSMTVLRDRKTETPAFVKAFDQVARQLLIAALDYIPAESFDITTPTGSVYRGVRSLQKVCGISILRAGASMEEALRQSYSGPLNFGKILIQRDEATCLPTHLYSKFPKDIADRYVLILEPMLATGGSASKAIEQVIEAGASEHRIIFVNLVASQWGLTTLTKRFPGLKVVTAAVDPDLTASNHVAPGIGDFGDRYYGTTD